MTAISNIDVGVASTSDRRRPSRRDGDRRTVFERIVDAVAEVARAVSACATALANVPARRPAMEPIHFVIDIRL